MQIDIHPGDTFTINPDSVFRQTRGDKRRRFGDSEWWTGSVAGEAHVSMDVAKQIIHAAGHTITEATPQPTPVPWPTHAVVSVVSGAICNLGTEQECIKYRTSIGASEITYTVRPLAPAPMSDKMRALIDALDNAAYCGWTDDARAELRKAARALLAEGGAA